MAKVRFIGVKKMLAMLSIAGLFVMPQVAVASSTHVSFKNNQLDIRESKQANDVAWVVDPVVLGSAEKMELINQIKAGADQVYSRGGRMALVLYRTGYCKQIDAVSVVSDFTANTKVFEKALKSLNDPYLSCGQNKNVDPQDLVSKLENLKWSIRGQNNLVFFGDQSFVNAVASSDAVKEIAAASGRVPRGVRILPVLNAVEAGKDNSITKLATQTGGKVFYRPAGEFLATQANKNRVSKKSEETEGAEARAQLAVIKEIYSFFNEQPIALFPLRQYQVSVMQELNLDLGPSYLPAGASQVSYEIDCDSDGQVEFKAQDMALARCQYLEPGEYQVTGKVTLPSGYSSIATAKVQVDEDSVETVDPQAVVTNLQVGQLLGQTGQHYQVQLNWESEVSPQRWLVRIGGKTFGSVDGTSREVKINNLVANENQVSFAVVPVYKTGKIGEPATIQIRLPKGDGKESTTANTEKQSWGLLGKHIICRSEDQECDRNRVEGVGLPDAGAYAGGVASISILAVLTGSLVILYRRAYCAVSGKMNQIAANKDTR